MDSRKVVIAFFKGLEKEAYIVVSHHVHYIENVSFVHHSFVAAMPYDDLKSHLSVLGP